MQRSLLGDAVRRKRLHGYEYERLVPLCLEDDKTQRAEFSSCLFIRQDRHPVLFESRPIFTIFS